MSTALRSVDDLLGAASSQSGLDAFGDDWFHQPLAAWVEDLGSGLLNDFGRTFLSRLAVRDVVRRQRVLEELRRHPEIAEVEVPPILYVTGLERSGTTLLHNLLSLHRSGRALLRWELMEPLPPPEASNYATDLRIAKVQAPLEKLRGTPLERMHWVEATDPEECPWGFFDGVGMLGQAASMCMPTWRRFLQTQDLTPAYRNYRRLIQLLLWKNPLPQDGFLVLKAPQIANSISQFAEVFPEARFVITDRDPFRVITSLVVMTSSIVDPFCVDNPLRDDGCRDRVGLERARIGLRSLAAFSDQRPERQRHLLYRDLVADPSNAARSVLDWFGRDDDPTLDDRVAAFLEAQRAGRRAPPPKVLPTEGYDQDRVRAERVVAEYCERFAVPPEHTRLTGARRTSGGDATTG